MHPRKLHLLWMICISVVITTVLTGSVLERSKRNHIDDHVISSIEYREQNIGDDMIAFIRTVSKPGKYVGLYLLESKYGYQEWRLNYRQEVFEQLEKDWIKNSNFNQYMSYTEAIWNDVKYFPIPEFKGELDLKVSYVDTWMAQRTYGGERGHEGTDIMAHKNQRGLYPVLSMTDGVVSKKGWLEKGGYRIGILSPSGAYFYYAHLDSYANIEEGDEVKAGDILGYMGDSGYGPEGTVGQFAVHLHLGIYLYPNGEEMSVNPYWVLRYIENRKVKCYTEK